LAVKSNFFEMIDLPSRTTFLKSLSRATSHRMTERSSMPSTRVHRVTPLVVGWPAATPCSKLPPLASGMPSVPGFWKSRKAARAGLVATAIAPAPAAAPPRNLRRS
jgi:hypothetical protein